MAIEVYLYFNGNCREAVEYYSEVFDSGTPRIMAYGETPENPEQPMSDEMKQRVMHATLNIEGSHVMFSDVPSDYPFTVGNNVSLTVVTRDADRIQRLYDKLKPDSVIKMELQETFWSKSYAMLTDKFGIEWQLSHDNGDPNR